LFCRFNCRCSEERCTWTQIECTIVPGYTNATSCHTWGEWRYLGDNRPEQWTVCCTRLVHTRRVCLQHKRLHFHSQCIDNWFIKSIRNSRQSTLTVVHRYNLSNNVITKWSVGGTCYRLSLTSTHNVLVTLWDTKQIQEYTPDGRLMRKISLDCSIGSPYHSVQLAGDRFVVGHSSNSLQRVCLVDTSGRIIQCYRGARGSGVGQLNEPGHLAVDRHGNVLVTDQGNNRVVLLSPSLTHLGYIHTPGHQLRRPWSLHLDDLTHRLYIGEWTNTGRVFVLTFDQC